MADRRTYNVVVLGVGFLFIFTAFTTCGNVEVSYKAIICVTCCFLFRVCFPQKIILKFEKELYLTKLISQKPQPAAIIYEFVRYYK